MASPLLVVAIAFAALAVVLFLGGLVAVRKGRIFGTAMSLAAALALLSLGGLFATLAVATQGYRAFTREEVVAVVETRPTGEQSFNATFRFPDGSEQTFSLAGDEFYVDAHILKWKPLANVLGLHTAYELDRVSGRYLSLRDEQDKPRTVFALGESQPAIPFDVLRDFPLFRPLVDAEYGSATFMLADESARFEVLVSTSGLLVRTVQDQQR